MKGIIIAGGFGTRLRPLTHNRPKHLLPVANRPFLEYQVALLKQHGIAEITFATNYYADLIEAHFGDGSEFGVKMRYALETEPLGTAGAIRNAADLASDDAVVVFNGDILTDFDLTFVLEFHRNRNALATIALRAVERPHAFGVVGIDQEGWVRSWREPSEEEKKRIADNPGPPTGESDFINAGIYVLEPQVIHAIPTGRSVSIERETYPGLIAANTRVFGVAPKGYWMDIGRPEQYLAANEAVLSRMVSTKVPFEQISSSAVVHPSAEIDAHSSIGPRVQVGENSRISRCIILEGSAIGSHTDLAGLIADKDVRIGDATTARSGSILAEGCVIQPGTRLS